MLLLLHFDFKSEINNKHLLGNGKGGEEGGGGGGSGIVFEAKTSKSFSAQHNGPARETLNSFSQYHVPNIDVTSANGLNVILYRYQHRFSF